MSTLINSFDLTPFYIQSGYGIPDHFSTLGSEYTDLYTAFKYVNKDGLNNWVKMIDDSFNTWSGGTVTGPTIFTDGLSANTISATTYYNLPLDIYITGSSFNNGTYDLILTRNDDVNITSNLGFLSSDIKVTGGTYNINTGIVTFTNNSGGTFNVSGFSSGMTDTYTTGGTLNDGTTTFTKSDGTTYNVTGYTTPFTGGTVAGLIKYNSDLSSTYDSRTLVDKQYVDDRLVNYSEFRIYLNAYATTLSYIGSGSWATSGTILYVAPYTGRYSSTTTTQTIGFRNPAGGNMAYTDNNSLFARFSIGNISAISFLHFGYGAGSGAFPNNFNTSPGISFGFASGDTTFSIKYTAPFIGNVSLDTTMPITTDTFQVKFLKSPNNIYTYTIYNETTKTKVTGQVTTNTVLNAESLCASNGSSGQAITLDFKTLINKTYYNI